MRSSLRMERQRRHLSVSAVGVTAVGMGARRARLATTMSLPLQPPVRHARWWLVPPADLNIGMAMQQLEARAQILGNT